MKGQAAPSTSHPNSDTGGSEEEEMLRTTRSLTREEVREKDLQYGVSPYVEEREEEEDLGKKPEQGEEEGWKRGEAELEEGGLEPEQGKGEEEGRKIKGKEAETRAERLQLGLDEGESKPCIFVKKRRENGEHITCGEPIPVAAVPSLCRSHLQKYQMSTLQALVDTGADTSNIDRSAIQFSAIIAEYVSRIEAKRREALKNSSKDTMDQKDEEKDEERDSKR